jgi:hypothetical protein
MSGNYGSGCFVAVLPNNVHFVEGKGGKRVFGGLYKGAAVSYRGLGQLGFVRVETGVV